MKYIHAVLLLHKVNRPITEENISKVLISSGFKVDPNRIKILLDSLKGIDIENVLKSIPVPVVQPKEKVKEVVEEKEPEEKLDATAEGLRELFGAE